MALTHGLQACWATPISSAAGRVLGAFAIYLNEPRTPASLDQSLIEQITQIASIAIERTQRDAMLRRSEALLAQAQRLSSTCSFSWRVATEEIAWSEEVFRIFELDRAAPVTNELFRSRVHPEDFPVLREMMDRARGGNGIDFEYEHRLLMPDHRVKYVSMVCEGIRSQDGQLEYIAAVQDVTQRRRVGRSVGNGPVGARTRGQDHKPRGIDSLDCARGQPAAVGDYHQRQYLSADA